MCHFERKAILLLTLLCCACVSDPAAPEVSVEGELHPPPALAPMRPPRPLDDDGIFYVLGPSPAHPRVRYVDGQLSLNETCAIRVENKLKRKIPPAYVNGRPVGFC
jgi:hypothetical protein